jgi:hypothetical protein
MKNQGWIAPFLLMGIVAALASCSPPLATCPTEELVAPVLVAPGNGDTVNTRLPTLTWSYPANCTPEGYRIDLSPVVDFTDTSLSGGTGDPSTSWSPGEELQDCIVYFWRVAGINGTTLGPFSGVRGFTVDETGTCEPPTPVPGSVGAIRGIVWHDLCAVGMASDLPLQPGCIEVPGVDGSPVPAANGILEPGEPGLAFVQVDLGSGPCPSTGLSSASTGADGTYSFEDLVPGDYCVSVDALSETNSAVLIPGGWSSPTRDVEPAEAEVAVAAGDAVVGVNFGWDFQFLPNPPTPPPSASATPVPTPTSPGAQILGFLWNDVCEWTGGGPNNAPIVLGDGCIGDPNGVWGANGVFDSGEPVFAGVTFRLAAGTCNAPPYASATTNGAGYFGFVNVPPGSYCLIMNALDSGNASILIPGGSTTHPMTSGQILIPFTLDPGDTMFSPAIGWEFQHLG